MFTENKSIEDNEVPLWEENSNCYRLPMAEVRNKTKNIDIGREWKERRDTTMEKNWTVEDSFRWTDAFFYLSFDDFETRSREKNKLISCLIGRSHYFNLQKKKDELKFKWFDNKTKSNLSFG